MVHQEKTINLKDVHRYLSLAKSLKGPRTFYDMHVHPFEIVFTKGAYQKVEQHPGLYSTGSKPFVSPQLKEVIIQDQADKASTSGMLQRPAIFRMKFSALYAHSGPEVFKQQMDLSAIDRVLLLPVAQAEGNIESQMRDMKEFFSGIDGFLIGWSVSNEIKNKDILKEILTAIKNYNICSIKQNLTQCEIDISKAEGKTRLESILDACSRLNLPLILHTGRSPLAGSAELSQFGEIETLETFDWGAYKNPIVFAHSAAYGYSADKIQNYIIPRLKNLFSTFENIFIDISGVDIFGMQYLLAEVPTERILFGSDALYEPQWQRVVKLLYALDNSALKLEESFLKIISYNPEKYIFR